MCSATSLSRIAISSACCSAELSPALDGQSMFPTVATHTARNSRGTGGGALSAVTLREAGGATWPLATTGTTMSDARVTKSERRRSGGMRWREG